MRRTFRHSLAGHCDCRFAKSSRQGANRFNAHPSVDPELQKSTYVLESRKSDRVTSVSTRTMRRLRAVHAQAMQVSHDTIDRSTLRESRRIESMHAHILRTNRRSTPCTYHYHHTVYMSVHVHCTMLMYCNHPGLIVKKFVGRRAPKIGRLKNNPQIGRKPKNRQVWQPCSVHFQSLATCTRWSTFN